MSKLRVYEVARDLGSAGPMLLVFAGGRHRATRERIDDRLLERSADRLHPGPRRDGAIEQVGLTLPRRGCADARRGYGDREGETNGGRFHRDDGMIG